MISRQTSGLVASVLAVGLMACTSSLPNATGDGTNGDGTKTPTPGFGAPSPFTELEAPGRVDEAVEDPIDLDWNLNETESVPSPRDQQIKRIHGALRQDQGYKFFLQQGDTFYHRTVASGGSAPTWSTTSKLGAHRNLTPTRLFSDGDWLFCVNDSNETTFSGQEAVWQARSSTNSEWAHSGLPAGIVAVTGGPGLAFAATETQLFMWNGSSWAEIESVNLSAKSERFAGLSLDLDLPGNDLIVLLKTPPFGTPYSLKKLSGNAPGATLEEAKMGFNMPADSPAKVIRSVPYIGMDYHYWARSTSNFIFYGSGNFTMQRFEPKQTAMKEPFTRTFRGLSRLMGRFYAYRSDAIRGPEIYHLKDDNDHSWQTLSAQKRVGGGRLTVSLDDEQSVAVDGQHLFAAGAEGLFRYPLTSWGEPAAYQAGLVGWEQEPVELNRASVQRILRCGSTNYARTAFGTYVQSGGAWIPFELEGLPATVFASHYGQAATTFDGATVRLYLFLNGTWTRIDKPWPAGAQPQAAKVFFAKGRIFMGAVTTGGEVLISRFLDTDSEWRQALPTLSSAPSFYMSDGKTVFAVDASRVKLASLETKVWKDYPNMQVLPDGSTKALQGSIFEYPFAVYGYSFAWVKIGGEYKLCRATATGWKPIVSDQLNGGTVDHQLSTDGHYLYGWVKAPSGFTQAIVRLPIKGGSSWAVLPVTIQDTRNTNPIALADITVNGPVVIDRAQAKVFLPTSRGIVGRP